MLPEVQLKCTHLAYRVHQVTVPSSSAKQEICQVKNQNPKESQGAVQSPHLFATAVSLPYGLRAGLRLSIHTIPVCVQFLQAGGNCGSCRFGSVLQESKAASQQTVPGIWGASMDGAERGSREGLMPQQHPWVPEHIAQHLWCWCGSAERSQS